MSPAIQREPTAMSEFAEFRGGLPPPFLPAADFSGPVRLWKVPGRARVPG